MSNIISRKFFKYCLSSLENHYTLINKLNSLIKKYNEETIIDFDNMFCLTIKILEENFNDKINEWIKYYIYELEFGRKYEPSTVFIDGVIVPLKTIDDLYDILISNIDNK